MNGDTGRTDTKPTNVRWIVFALGCGTSWILYLHRYIISLFKSDIQTSFDLTSTQLGYLDATFFWCYAIFQVPLGICVDFLGAHLFLAGIILVWSVALAMHAWAPTVSLLYVARGLFGSGQAAAFAALSRISRNWFPSAIRTRVQGWVGVFFARGGGFCGYLLGGALVGMLARDWRVTVYVVAGLGIVHGILFLVLFRNSPRRHFWANGAEADHIEGSEGSATGVAGRMSIKEMVGRMSGRSLLNLGFLCVAACFSGIADLVYSHWIPIFLERVHGLKKAEMGIFAALPLAGGMLGGVVGGILNDRLIRNTRNPRWTRSLMGFAGKGLAAVMLGIALLFYAQPYVFVTLLIAVKFFADISLATRWGAVTDIGGKVTATVFATVNAIGILATIAGSVVYGSVIPQSVEEMKDAAGWLPMFFIGIGVYVACAVSWLLVNCTIPVLAEKSPGPEETQA